MIHMKRLSHPSTDISDVSPGHLPYSRLTCRSCELNELFRVKANACNAIEDPNCSRDSSVDSYN